MTIDENNPKHVIADEGKVLARISNGDIYGTEIVLGLIPGTEIEDVVENFEEIDMPEPEEPVSEEETTEEPSEEGELEEENPVVEESEQTGETEE